MKASKHGAITLSLAALCMTTLSMKVKMFFGAFMLIIVLSVVILFSSLCVCAIRLLVTKLSVFTLNVVAPKYIDIKTK